MNHIGLFEGIGGFSIASRWMGWNTIAWCEINPFCQKILSYHFQNAEKHSDITTTDFTIYRGKCDILTGGFPCQPFSSAGKRKGTDDERYLWGSMLRAIREIQPRYVVGENVRGLTNWNGGLVFDQVQADLEAEGFEVLPFLLPACAVNAPHRRDRIWFVAYSDKCTTRPPRTGRRFNRKGGENDDVQKERGKSSEQYIRRGDVLQDDSNPTSQGLERIAGKSIQRGSDGLTRVCFETDSYADDKGLERGTQTGNVSPEGTKRNEQSVRLFELPNWENFPTQSPVCGGNDGLPAGLVGITFPKFRAESIMAYGNAIVPQVALQLFKAIEETDKIMATA